MIAYVVRRCLYAFLTFIGITIATFVLIHSVPGDPITFYLSTHLRPSYAALEAVRREYHLDKPLPTQYLYWAKGVMTLDFGRSTVDRRPVSELIFEKLPHTLQLNVIAFALAAFIGLPVGLWSAARSGRTI